MKPKAEPCINNYLTIHVPAATLLNEYRSKRKEKEAQDKNPFMNQKLQLIKDTNPHNKTINHVHTSLPNKSFAKKRKTQAIPLLSNIKINSEMNLRIVKEQSKNVYNLVFEKKPLRSTVNLFRRELSDRQLTSQTSRRSMPRNISTSDTARRTSNRPYQQYKTGAPVKIDSMHWPPDISQSALLRISGNRAPTCDMMDSIRKSSQQNLTRSNMFYRQGNPKHSQFEQYI